MQVGFKRWWRFQQATKSLVTEVARSYTQLLRSIFLTQVYNIHMFIQRPVRVFYSKEYSGYL